MTVETTTKLEILPETPSLGAVVKGVSGKEALSPEVVATLKKALLQYKVLFFRGLHLDREEHVAFTTHFGAPWINPSGFTADYDDDGVSGVTVVPSFHADVMYMPDAPSFSMLRMIELPEVGGDTLWADLVTSYQDLSPILRSFLETLKVEQGQRAYDLPDDVFAAEFSRRKGVDLAPEELRRIRTHLKPWEAPLVRVIPETGIKNYWVSAQHTRKIVGLSREESDAILGVLFRHQLQPKYLYRWRWHVGDIAFWDHRTTLHCGISDFGEQKRYAERVSVANNTPIGVAEHDAGIGAAV